MSVVAGAALFDGVLVGADTRISWSNGTGVVRVADCGLKVFPLADRSVIGFVAGDVREAARLLARLEEHFFHRRRTDPQSLRTWLPRFFRHWYQRERCQLQLGFLVGSALPNRPTVLPRSHLLRLLDEIARGEGSLQRNWLPGELVQALRTPADVDPVSLSCGAAPLLYSMCSPSFEAREARPLEILAIGSGERALAELERCHDAITGFPGDPFTAAMYLRDALRRYAHQNRLPDVGGSFPVFEVSRRGLVPHSIESEIPVGGTRLALVFDGRSSWIQRNLTTGKTLPLLPPWQIPAEIPSDQRFDDWNTAWAEFLGPAAVRATEAGGTNI